MSTKSVVYVAISQLKDRQRRPSDFKFAGKTEELDRLLIDFRLKKVLDPDLREDPEAQCAYIATSFMGRVMTWFIYALEQDPILLTNPDVLIAKLQATYGESKEVQDAKAQAKITHIKHMATVQCLQNNFAGPNQPNKPSSIKDRKPHSEKSLSTPNRSWTIRPYETRQPVSKRYCRSPTAAPCRRRANGEGRRRRGPRVGLSNSLIGCLTGVKTGIVSLTMNTMY